MGLKEELIKTKRGTLLWDESTDYLIETEPKTIKINHKFDHPYSLLKQTDEFKKLLIAKNDEPKVAILGDMDIFTLFKEQLPQFYLAGAHKKIVFNPADNNKILKVGVLTAGGNAPGLDTIVDSLVKHQFSLWSLNKEDGTELNQLDHGYPRNLKFYGLKGGYKGLLELGNSYAKEIQKDSGRGTPWLNEQLKQGEKHPWIMELTPRITDSWSLRGCSSLHALRHKDALLRETIKNLAEVSLLDKSLLKLCVQDQATGKYLKIEKEDLAAVLASIIQNILELDIIYTVGGDGTLGVAKFLSKMLNTESKSCIVVAGPKTMDNDINFTDYTFGFRTTSDNAIKLLGDFHRETETLERLGIIELFGAGSGFVALHAAYACGEVDYVLIPEMVGDTVETALTELDRMIERLERRLTDKKHALLVVAEGASLKVGSALKNEGDKEKKLREFEHGDKALKESAFKNLEEKIKEKIIRIREKRGEKVEGIDTLVSQPKHLIRATPPNGFDIDLCKYTGKLMVDTALAGFTGCSVHLWQGNYVLVPLTAATAITKRVDVNSYYFKSMQEKYLLK